MTNINNEASLLTVTPSPHVRRSANVRTIMAEVAIALLPAAAWGVYVFGWRALTLMLISVASSVLFELLFELALKRTVTISDFSAVVTGLLIGMNLPVTVPLWIPVAGSAFAILLVKQIFGGLGKNFLNPAMAARVFLFMSFPAHMSTFTAPFVRFPFFGSTSDAVASATILTEIKGGTMPSVSLLDAFLGKTGGTIGEVSSLLLLLGGIYLLIRGIIQWQIPVAYILTTGIMFLIFPQMDGHLLETMLYELLAGGLFIGAFYMATDYVTSPVTKWGRLIFGAGCGLLTFFFRVFGSNTEGVSFAILIMNCLVFYIDRLTMPRIFGGKQKK